jgi:hypothetical protein
MGRSINVDKMLFFIAMYRSSALIEAYGSLGKHWLVCCIGLLAVYQFSEGARMYSPVSRSHSAAMDGLSRAILA